MAKYIRKFNEVSDANTAGAAGLESPHVDLVTATDAVNIKEVNTTKFTCEFDDEGHMINAEPLIPETWKIYYTTTDGSALTLNYTSSTYFGANVVSNTYDATTGGCIAFDGEVTKMCGPESMQVNLFGITLLSINIPSSVTNIGIFACSSLSSITIPDSVTSIGYCAFCYCTSLSSVTIGNGVTSIGNYAFFMCSSLSSITIGSGVTSIGESAFVGCDSLPVVEGVQYTSSAASDNPYLISYTDDFTATTYAVLEGTKWVGDYAFYRCTSLSSITIPDSVTSIGYWAFIMCSSLSSINIPSGVTTIGESAFVDCDSLPVVEGVQYTSSAASDNPYLISYTDDFTATTYAVLEGTKWIGDYCFYYCESLSSITIPDSVTSIGMGAFAGCESLSSINIPSGVTTIGESAFVGCDSLTSFTCNATTPPTLGNDAFYSVPSTMPIYVPSASVDAYKAATNWSSRADYIQAIPS